MNCPKGIFSSAIGLVTNNPNTKPPKALLPLIIFAALAQFGCVSMSSLQTAEVLEPGKAEETIGGGYYTSDALNGTTGTSEVKLPYIEWTHREGVFPNWDLGFKITIIGSAVVDAKYQLLKSEKFHLATGLGLGYLSISTTVGSGSEETKSTTSIYDLIVPLYASYQLSEMVTGYITPKFVARFGSGANSNLLGTALGVKWGKEMGAYLEAGYQKQLGGTFDAIQYNASFFWAPKEGYLKTFLK